ncbi:pseudouridine synthase [Legionella norrlandica]|uniref:tRNA pseudouridine synthase B n=1 Tax=Legionella norrlandica TaxID=1498499 RepID=A0A0A2TAC0_9GAMM|nr:tRNA pseudouridine(55) synthase TruB [Legionella norrlandica]KGP64358.1 pseudouridine synthase [Legionella norrlandica]
MTTTVETQYSINGILLLNKPKGISSNAALQKAKYLFGAKKAGHTGSLDPLATGMLPICFGEATKICEYLLNADKCYETTGRLGIKTNTSDSTGEVIFCAAECHVNNAQLLEVLEKHKGKIKQIPSMFSALKHNGTPLYRLAREGIEIERKARDILISHLQLEQFDGESFSLIVKCSKGTYIRNLIEDIGDALNVGAHMTRLHRLYTSGFQNSPMYSLDELQNMPHPQKLNCLIPMDQAIDYLVPVTLTDSEVISIRQGRILSYKSNVSEGDYVRLYNIKSEFVGIGIVLSHGDIKAKRLLSFSP